MNEYYGELCTQIYEKDKSIADGEELEFFLSFIKDKKMKVLEPMCGNGRMLIPLMENGIDIEGFDISEEMLRVCKLKGQRLNLKPSVSYGKIEDFKSDKKYDLIIIPFGSFSLLSDEVAQNSIANMRTILKEDGKLLLTVMSNKDQVEDIPDWIETNRHYFDNNEIVEYKKVHYDRAKKLLKTKLKYQLFKDGEMQKSEIMDFPIRLYGPGEFENVLKSNGFDGVILHEVINGYGEGNSLYVFECVI